MTTNAPPSLVLASTSPYRRMLLERLEIPFLVESPGIDETPRNGECPADLAHRLALAKAEAVAGGHPGSVVIGSDQVCELHGRALGKPGTHERAIEQLLALQGNTATFHTAVAVVCREKHFAAVRLSPVRVRFRPLSLDTIERYLSRERPYDCAGSAKSEGLGIALLEEIHSQDPTALIGLPLTTVAALLRQCGVDPLGPPSPPGAPNLSIPVPSA